MNNRDWTGHWIQVEPDSSIPSIDELNWHNEDMREPFRKIVSSLRYCTETQDPLTKDQIDKIYTQTDNLYEFVRLIEKAHNIKGKRWKSN